MLMENNELADSLGENGRDYVEKMYEWSRVISMVENTLEVAKEQFAKRTVTLHRSN